MHFDISLIPTDVVNFCKKAATFTTTLENDLKSNIAIDITAAIDTAMGTGLSETIRQTLITVATDAVTAIGKLENAVETPAVQGIFQRLGADLTQLAHNSDKHTLSYYIGAFEAIINDVFGKGNATVTPIVA